MPMDPWIAGAEPAAGSLTDEEGAGLPQDEAMPAVGAAPDPDASGEDAGDAARRAAGADPAAAGTDGELPSMLLPTPD